jgi:hypothetical protein
MIIPCQCTSHLGMIGELRKRDMCLSLVALLDCPWRRPNFGGTLSSPLSIVENISYDVYVYEKMSGDVSKSHPIILAPWIPYGNPH